MSQKGEEFDFSYKNLYQPLLMPPPTGPNAAANLVPPSQFMPPSSNGQINPYYWDWWNNYYSASTVTNPSPFDIGYRDELTKNDQLQIQKLQQKQQSQQDQQIHNLQLNRHPLKQKIPDSNDQSDRLSVYSSASNRSNSHHSWASRDSLNDINYQVFNQAFPPAQQSATPLKQNSLSSNQQKQSSANQTSVNQPITTTNQQSQIPAQNPLAATGAFMPPPIPFMDPTYMYYHQMTYGYHPMQTFPFGIPTQSNLPPYGLPFMSSASLAGGQRQLQEDQQSIHSYHFDLEARSEKKMNLINNRPQSVAAHNFKTEVIDKGNRNFTATSGAQTGLLMEDPSQNKQATNAIPVLEVSNDIINLKRDEHRMTPLIHQLPHVRATFSLNSLIKVRANDPCEGQPALVDITNLSDLMEQYLNNLKNLKLDDKQADSNDFTDDYLSNNISREMRNDILANYKLLQEFPGPLIKEHTSKAQLIQFCQKNVKECLSNTNVNLIDPQSHALLWDYLALLVRQNGIVDLKTDISPLLLSGIADLQQHPAISSITTTINTSTTSSASNKLTYSLTHSVSSASLFAMQQQQDFVIVSSESSNGNNESNELVGLNETKSKLPASNQQQSQLQIDEDIHLNKLRQLLGAGQRPDAIELAVKHNMWPHALFLASSLSSNMANSNNIQTSNSLVSLNQQNPNTSILNESKALNKVKIRFINSLPTDDPIHTCYQLLVGRIPSVATNISKSEWNEWRRHLAMIVSNIDETNKDLVLNSIKTMGDTLASNGRVAASHFCYLLSDCSFGTFNKKSSKLVLVGSSHNQDFSKFCQISSIQATEIYEFAESLAPSLFSSSYFTLDHFVKYKLIYATKLLEFGFINEAYKYIEVIAKAVNSNPKLHSDKISAVYQLGNRLRVYDSDFAIEDLINLNNEPQWLQELANNFKKLHLNKLWHLLTDNSLTEETREQLSKPKEAQNSSVQSSALLSITDVNVLTKNEPKTSEPSPSSIQNLIYVPSASLENQLEYIDQEYQIKAQTVDLSAQMNNISIDNNPNENIQFLSNSSSILQTQEFSSQYQQDQTKNQQYQMEINQYSQPNNFNNAQTNQQQKHHNSEYNQHQPNKFQSDQYHQQLYQKSQPAQITSRRFTQDAQNQHSNKQASSQFYIPSGHQTSNQPVPSHDSRKSSTSSNQNSASHSGQLGYNSKNQAPSQVDQHQVFNFNQLQQTSKQMNQTANFHFSNNAPQQRRLSTSSIGGSSNQAQAQVESHSFSQNRYGGNRSRQSSSSTSHNDLTQTPFVSFNPYQSVQKLNQQRTSSQSQYFDPNTSVANQLTKSPSLPINQSENQMHLSQSIKEEDTGSFQKISDENSNSKNDDQDEDNFSNKTKSESRNDDIKQQNNQNDWWFKRMIKSIRPTNTAKAMVLPDDKKKTIVWDDKLKKYVNTDVSDDPSTAIKPPPIFLPMKQDENQIVDKNASSISQQDDSQANQQAPNRFSLKNTSKRTNYYSKIDIMADKTKKFVEQPPIAFSNLPPPSQLPPRIFVPEANQQQELQQPEQFQQNASQNSELQNQDYYYQQQQQQQKQQIRKNQEYAVNFYQPNYSQNENNYVEETDSATNSADSYNGSSQTSSNSNESAYIQNQYNQQQQYAFSQQHAQQNYDPNNFQPYSQDQYYDHHSNI